MLLVAVGGSRVLLRYWLGGHYRKALQRQDMPGTLIYGAGSAGQQLAAALRTDTEQQRMVGFLDDDPSLHNHHVNSWPVYAPSELPKLIERLGIKNILLAIPSVDHQRRLAILEILRQYPVHVRTLPGLGDLVAGRVPPNFCV